MADLEEAPRRHEQRGKRTAGAGHLYEKWGSYYGRWRTLDGRLLNRKVGRIRTPGTRDGLTRAQAEREFRRLQDAEERAPRPAPGAEIPTVDEVADSLREKLALSGSRRSNSTPNPDPVATLNEARRATEAALRASMRGKVDDLPSWLTAKVKSISVAFDDTTKRHYEDLVKSARAGELIDATAQNDHREATHAIGLREQWREALVPHLSDPATRSFEVVFSDPTPQNIARVVDQVNATDAVARERVFHVLSSLIEADHLNKTSELPKMMKEIMAGLRIGEGQEPLTLEEATPAPAIDAESHTIEHPEPHGDDS